MTVLESKKKNKNRNMKKRHDREIGHASFLYTVRCYAFFFLWVYFSSQYLQR